MSGSKLSEVLQRVELRSQILYVQHFVGLGMSLLCPHPYTVEETLR